MSRKFVEFTRKTVAEIEKAINATLTTECLPIEHRTPSTSQEGPRPINARFCQHIAKIRIISLKKVAEVENMNSIRIMDNLRAPQKMFLWFLRNDDRLENVCARENHDLQYERT